MLHETAAIEVCTSDPDHCPVERTLAVIAGRWKPLILFHVRAKPRRFNGLRGLIPGVTQRMLTLHLRELQDDGILARTVYQVMPPHVEYAVTEKGATLFPLLDAMATWGMARASEQAAPMPKAA